MEKKNELKEKKLIKEQLKETQKKMNEGLRFAKEENRVFRKKANNLKLYGKEDLIKVVHIHTDSFMNGNFF